jgi:glycerophosphoryl diester phosphodiesterase
VPHVIAHRGASGTCPENTRAAFDEARRQHADGIEFDVQLSADEVLVVHHDRTLRKTTGLRQSVRRVPMARLERLDFGVWFSPEFRGERILTLDDVLTGYGDLELMLELKTDGEQSGSRRWARLVDAATDAVLQQGIENRVHMLSFDPAALRRVYRRRPSLRCVLDLDDPCVAVRGPWSAVCMPARQLGRDRADVVRIAGKQLWVYRCDTQRNLTRALRWGASVLITDHPQWLRAAMVRALADMARLR